MLLEFCAENMTDVPVAIAAGAKRIELCDNLAVGGTTPSVGVIECAVSYAHTHGARVMCMIRPRGGGFIYNEDELAMMESDARMALALGVDGIVLGCLRRNYGGAGDYRTLDIPALERFAALVREVERKRGESIDMTYHMAFDELEPTRQFKAIDTLISMGFTRILTHGGVAGSPITQNIPHLRELIEYAAGRIIILPGGGITAANAHDIAVELGIEELHGTKIVNPAAQAITLMEAQPDSNRFQCVIEPLKLGRTKVKMLDPTLGVLTQFSHDATFYAAPFNEGGARAMKRLIPRGSSININDTTYQKIFTSDTTHTGTYEFWVYPGTTAPDSGYGAADLDIKPLTPDYVDVIDEHYDLMGKPEILERLRSGWVRGGFDKTGALVGFIGEHEEASMGMLEVFPEARRHGYAQALEATLIGELLAQGRVPYCHVAPDNEASKHLQTKLGLVKTATLQCWTRVS